ncbi:MAG: glutaminyl-peptide cyclotransferase [Chloroflexi bacterium]|nr:glutaminyl-peptide cyclotransferase [Chloroflexota bacterium]
MPCVGPLPTTPSAIVVPAPFYDARIINTYPHDATAFTQGLQLVNGDFIEGTGLYGRSTLRRVDLNTGQVEKQIALDPAFFGEGVAVFEDRIYQITWKEQTAFVYELDTFNLVETFSYTTQGWGLTHDGRCLLMSDGSNVITFRDPDTFTAVATLSVFDANGPVTQLNELEFIDGELYANIWQQNRIVRISPETGEVVGWILLDELAVLVGATNSDDVLNGIAYDAENGRLFVTGKRWPTLFEIELQPIE